MENEYPPLIVRLQSIFIDTVVIIIFMIIFSFVLDYFPGTPDWVRILLFLSVFVFYEPFCTAFGCTIGNYLRKIRVRKFTDTTSRINLFQATIRFAMKILLGWVSFLTIHSNSSKRAIHDMAAASVMINYPN